MRNVIPVSLAILAGLSLGALAAANQEIHQKGRVFSAENVTIKKGEALTFVNDDTIPHNILSTSKGNEFNLGSQAPGGRDRRHLQGGRRRAGALRDPSAHEDDGEGHGLIAPDRAAGDF